jgi:hypothetical protein
MKPKHDIKPIYNKINCDIARKDERERIIKILDDLKLDDEFHDWNKSILGTDDELAQILDKLKSEIEAIE